MRRFFPVIFSQTLIRNVHTDGKNSFTQDKDASNSIEYHVPALTARTAGRQHEIMALWQGILSGKHTHVISGLNGIGKSVIAAEFCDCAKQSKRFSCIYWFKGEYDLPWRLSQFFRSMGDRKENDVLLVIDDAADPDEVLSLIRAHPQVYVVITTEKDVQSSEKYHVLRPSPLTESTHAEFSSSLQSNEVLVQIFAVLGYVPLLMQVACKILEETNVSAEALLKILSEKKIGENNILHISAALSVLVDIALAHVEKKFPTVKKIAATLSCYDITYISEDILISVTRDNELGVISSLSKLGLLSTSWEDSSYSIHSTMAKVLRSEVNKELLDDAARTLIEMWPRRMRRSGSRRIAELVWHTYTLLQHYHSASIDLSNDILSCLDRSATFLAHIECRHPSITANMWRQVYQHHKKNHTLTPDTVRIAREYGRLLHWLRDPSAQAVLADAFEICNKVLGNQSVESALILGCYSPYLEDSEKSIQLIDEKISILETSASSVDVVIGPEEHRMLLETLFVLAMRKGQILSSLGKNINDQLWTYLEQLDLKIKSKGAFQ